MQKKNLKTKNVQELEREKRKKIQKGKQEENQRIKVFF